MTSASASAQTERWHPEEIRRAYEACAAIAAAHYENFPVASLLLPRRTRPFLRSIYAFARTADDFADEGSLPPEERLRLLDAWERKLQLAAGGDADEAVFIALADTLGRTGLPVQLLADLLQAFRLDVTRTRHETYADLLGYCRYSANPVGRMVLHLFNRATPGLLALSDSLCTALQLTNFWQDVAVDWSRGRLYIPLEDCVRFGYHEADLSLGRADATFRALLRHQVRRTLALYDEARPLPGAVEGRLRLELALTWRGGREILRAIERQDYDVLSRRPVLTAGTKVRLLVQTLMRGLP
jgi:phytoene synthase